MSPSVVFTRRGFAARTAALTGATVLGGTAAACGQGQGPVGSPATQATGLKGKIHLYVRDDTVEQQGQTEVFFPTFKKVAPNVEVVHDIFAAANADDSYTLKLYTLFAAGTPPDIWGFGQNYFGFWARGMVADITQRSNRDKVNLDQFLPGLADKFKIKGKHYGLPQLTTFGTLLFYNKNLFDEAGLKYPTVDWEDKTWNFDKLLEYAQKLTKRAGQSDAQYGLSFGGSRP